MGASQLNLINYHFSFWGVIATLVLAGALIQSLVMLSIGGIIFSLAFLSILYAGPLGIQALAPWTILGIALLLTIGFSLIFFRPRHRYWEKRLHHHAIRMAHTIITNIMAAWLTKRQCRTIKRN
nr:hypothetical protein [Secundilactobacillus similis]